MTHKEKMDALTTCLRSIMNVNIRHKDLPQYIKRGTAVSSIISSSHREEILEMRRQRIGLTIDITADKEKEISPKKKTKKLK